MFFVRIQKIDYSSIFGSNHINISDYKILFNVYQALLDDTINSNSRYLYLICVDYNHVIIICSNLLIDLVDEQMEHINCIQSYQSNLVFKYLSPALLVLNIYSIAFRTNFKILILEVSVCNLYAFSLYYWFGFQIINKRSNYYATDSNCISNTAYTLANIQSLSKNRLRRHLL